MTSKELAGLMKPIFCLSCLRKIEEVKRTTSETGLVSCAGARNFRTAHHQQNN